MDFKKFRANQLKQLLAKSEKHALTSINYPSRGQTSVQEIYQTSQGKLFLKKVSKQNHIDCKIDVTSGTLAEREFWAFSLAQHLSIPTPFLCLLDSMTTVQQWLDFPDVRQYSTTQGRLYLEERNIFDCALFDWLTGQIDRHDANYLYDYVSKKIILIDCAHCFLKYSGSLPDYLKYFEVAYPEKLDINLSTKTSQKIKTLTSTKLKALVPLKGDMEQKSLMARLETLKNVQTIREIINLYRRMS